MNTLKIIRKNDDQYILLGDTYSIVWADKNKAQFDEIAKQQGYNTETVYAIVFDDKGGQHALIKEYPSFITVCSTQDISFKQ